MNQELKNIFSKFENSNLSEVCIIGKEYKETKRLKTKELIAFIERDIFLAVKNNILPPLEYQVSSLNPSNGVFLLKVDVAEKEVFSKTFEKNKLTKGFFLPSTELSNRKNELDKKTRNKTKTCLEKIIFSYNYIQYEVQKNNTLILRRFDTSIQFL